MSRPITAKLVDSTFSEHSYGFRWGRRAHDAVKAVWTYLQSGKRVVVDVDLAKFFDRVNHDIQIDGLKRRIDDAGVIRLVDALGLDAEKDLFAAVNLLQEKGFETGAPSLEAILKYDSAPQAVATKVI